MTTWDKLDWPGAAAASTRNSAVARNEYRGNNKGGNECAAATGEGLLEAGFVEQAVDAMGEIV